MRHASTTKIWSACRTVFSWVSAPMASISSFSFYGSTLAVASSRMMGASFIDASQKEVMSLAMVDFPLPEGPTKALMAAAQGQDEVGEGVDQLAPIVPDVSYQVSCQPHHQIFDGQALFACCLYGNPPLCVGRFDFCAVVCYTPVRVR